MDTNQEISRRLHNMLMSRSGEARLKMGCSMYETAKKLVIASILSGNPGISEQELRRNIFLRFYGNDFSPDMKNKIIQFI